MLRTIISKEQRRVPLHLRAKKVDVHVVQVAHSRYFSVRNPVVSSCVDTFFPAHTTLWLYTYSNGEVSPGFRLTPASFLYFGPDNKYTLDFGKFEFGTWQQKSDTLLLYPAGGKNSQFLIKYRKNNELQMEVVPGVVSDFSGSRGVFDSPLDNPFSVLGIYA